MIFSVAFEELEKENQMFIKIVTGTFLALVQESSKSSRI